MIITRNRLVLPLIISATALVAGCSQVPVKEVVTEESAVTVAISKSAENIHKDLLQLVQLKELSPHNFHTRKTPVAGPLSRKMTLKWVGTPEEAVKTISALIAFNSPKIVGKQPANVQSVIIDAVNKPAAEILEDIGLQMGNRAGLAIGENQISIVYEGAHE